ncbi:MAG: hypothetical protein KDB74_04295 [Flavobacteriales bacterium]|nr:hypothetical protein [Flavobacteriales bacterium]
MKNKLKHSLIALLSIAMISSCSKEDDEVKKEETNTTPTIETNSPPSGNYYTGILYGDIHAYPVWTADFVTFNKFTTQFESQNVSRVKVENDTVLIAYSDIHQLNYIAYAPVNALNNFKVISSSEPISEFSILNGIIIVYAVDGLNKYTGYCNLNLGMSSIQYGSVLSSTVEFSDFVNTGSAIIANHNNNSAYKMAYTTDGMTWNIPGTIDGGRFEVFGGKTWRFSALKYEYTTDTDLSSATWNTTILHLDSLNTTDTSGPFSESYLDVNSASSWRSYGRINNGGASFPALNTSTDQGLTWHTQLLTSIPNVNDNSYLDGQYFTINSLTIWNNNNTNYSFPIGVYTATNGVDFTFDNSQATIDRFNRFRHSKFVR